MMQDEPWYVKRLRELEAAAPVKHKGTTEPFVNSAAALVWVELLRLRWKTQRTTFPLPSNRLKKLGVSRDVKRRVLYDLERAGLISIERRSRKTPIVTLNLL